MHPKSAPIKPDPDASAGPKNYGGHIYSMFQGDEASRQKKLQQRAYFQELTRQIQEKKEPRSSELPLPCFAPPEKPLLASGNYAAELAKLPFVSIDDDKRLPRYQKKYEIENHVGINVNTSQVFNGVLQRDEAALLKQKKEEQQKEMQMMLMRQIQEKNRKKEEELAWRRKAEVDEHETAKIEADRESLPSPRKETEVLQSPILKPADSPVSKTLPSFAADEESVQDLNNLNDVVKKLIEEKEELRNKLMEQEQKIKELSFRPSQNFAEVAKVEPKTPTRAEKSEKPRSRPPKVRVASAQEMKLKLQHEQERAKLAVIEEKLENARKKRIEQTRIRVPQKPRRVSEAQTRVDSKESLTKASRIKTASSPAPKNAGLLESPKINRSEIDRHNLDTAGKSDFIYPDAEGNFPIADEIDKFVMNYEKRESPLVSFKAPYRLTPQVESDTRFTFTGLSIGQKREAKPLVANRQGFPSDIFRLP
jgi:hypothetical protein